jgi:hypothetical protein
MVSECLSQLRCVEAELPGKDLKAMTWKLKAPSKTPVTPLLPIICKKIQQNQSFTAAPTLYLVEKKILP